MLIYPLVPAETELLSTNQQTKQESRRIASQCAAFLYLLKGSYTEHMFFIYLQRRLSKNFIIGNPSYRIIFFVNCEKLKHFYIQF